MKSPVININGEKAELIFSLSENSSRPRHGTKVLYQLKWGGGGWKKDGSGGGWKLGRYYEYTGLNSGATKRVVTSDSSRTLEIPWDDVKYWSEIDE